MAFYIHHGPYIPIGDVATDIATVIKAGSKFLIACYGRQYYNSCIDTTETRIKVWRKKIKSGPVKLCDIPPTKEAAAENIKQAHYQVAHWRAAVSGVPLKMKPTEVGTNPKQQVKDLY